MANMAYQFLITDTKQLGSNTNFITLEESEKLYSNNFKKQLQNNQ